MNGNRIKLARLARCLSLQELSDQLAKRSFPISKGALSKFENNKLQPGEALLNELSAVVGVPADFFNRPEWVDFELEIHTPLNAVASVHEAELKAHIQVELERFLSVSDILGFDFSYQALPRYPVSLADQQSFIQTCREIRQKLNAGGYTIHSVCNLLEHNNWLLFPLSDIFNHIIFTGIEKSRNIRFLFYSSVPYPDDFRDMLLQELGRTMLSYEKNEEEEILGFFAREILLPQEIVYREFGTSRKHILFEELNRCKQTYGISKRSIMLRLRELNVISDENYTNFMTYLNKNNYIRWESPFTTELHFQEYSTLYSALVSKGVAEGLLSIQQGTVF